MRPQRPDTCALRPSSITRVTASSSCAPGRQTAVLRISTASAGLRSSHRRPGRRPPRPGRPLRRRGGLPRLPGGPGPPGPLRRPRDGDSGKREDDHPRTGPLRRSGRHRPTDQPLWRHRRTPGPGSLPTLTTPPNPRRTAGSGEVKWRRGPGISEGEGKSIGALERALKAAIG